MSQKNWKQKEFTAKDVYVAGLPRDYGTTALTSLFSVFGAVRGSKFIVPEDTKKCAYGFVEFSDSQAAQQAIKGLKDYILNNNKLTVRLVSNPEKKTKRKNRISFAKIQKQVLYYFSVDNMNTDDFLRRQMDKAGWIDIDIILKFNRMKSMQVTKNELMQAINTSKTIEIDANHNKIRMAFWKQYIPCYELQCKYDAIKQKCDLYILEISLLQAENDAKGQLIKQLMHEIRSIPPPQIKPPPPQRKPPPPPSNEANKLYLNELSRQLQTEYAEKDQVIELLKIENNQLKSQNATQDQLIKQLMDEQSNNREQLESVNQKCNDIEKQYHSVLQQSTNLWVQQQNLQTENEKKDQLIERLKFESNQLKSENDNLKNIQDRYQNLEMKLNQSISNERAAYDQMAMLQDEHKELQIRYNELEKAYKSDYTLWGAAEIVTWIIDLDQTKYKKYYNTLLENMINEGIDGSCLADLNRNDLHRLGVTQFKDKRDIYDNLQQLISDENALKHQKVKGNQQNEGDVNNHDTDFM